MTTRNQKRKQSAKTQLSSSNTNGVDFHGNQPIVALPASIPGSSRPELDGQNAAKVNLREETAIPNSIGSSSPRTPTPAAPVLAVVAVKSVKSATSNPVLRDICLLRSGDLQVVPEKVAKVYGFAAGPISSLDLSDPKVSEFFKVLNSVPSDAAPSVKHPVQARALVRFSFAQSIPEDYPALYSTKDFVALPSPFD